MDDIIVRLLLSGTPTGDFEERLEHLRRNPIRHRPAYGKIVEITAADEPVTTESKAVCVRLIDIYTGDSRAACFLPTEPDLDGVPKLFPYRFIDTANGRNEYFAVPGTIPGFQAHILDQSQWGLLLHWTKLLRDSVAVCTGQAAS